MKETTGVSDTELDVVAAAADAVADDQRQVARRARSMKRRRQQGWSWTKIADRERSPSLVELLRRSRWALAGSTARFTRLLARKLAAEGQSRRQIARHLGVTHQRVSAMLSADPDR